VEKIIGLINAYVRALDRKEVEVWATLFAREAAYSVLPRENVERGLPMAHVLDDSRDRISDRVDYIRKVWRGHYNEYQSRHILSNIVIEPAVDGQFSVSANFAVYITEAEGTTALLAVGEYQDIVVIEEGAARFKDKKVILDTAALPRGFVYPL
jgi:3-phenylpropionate/cinnamic acid dioxygenase small subunit